MANTAPKLLTERVPLLLSPAEVEVLTGLMDARDQHSRNTLFRTLLWEEHARQERRAERAHVDEEKDR